MNRIGMIVLLAALAHPRLFCAEPADAARNTYTFSFELDSAALTSAGIFDAEGHLVRSLWRMERLEPGRYTREWDGLDEFGAPAIAAKGGAFEYRVVKNGSTYRSLNPIGITLAPPAEPPPQATEENQKDCEKWLSLAQTPNSMFSVVIDEHGCVYTANAWCEWGARIKKWDASGKSLMFTATGGDGYRIAVDENKLYCIVGGWGGKSTFQDIRIFDRDSGKMAEQSTPSKHFRIYETLPPADQAAADPENSPSNFDPSQRPLTGIAVGADTIFVSDALANKILKFNKASGQKTGEFPVAEPSAIAISEFGALWIAHGKSAVNAYSLEGKQLEASVSGTDISAVAVRAGKLAVADSGAHQVKVYDISSGDPKLLRAFGKKMEPFNVEPDSYHYIRGVALGLDGSLAVVDRYATGTRLILWSAEGKLLWRVEGTEFVSTASYSPDQPDVLYSQTFNAYKLDRASGSGTLLGATRLDFLHDAQLSYNVSGCHAAPEILTLNEQKFFYNFRGDGVQVFRVEPNGFHLSALVGGKELTPEGSKAPTKTPMSLWSWHDANGAGAVQSADIQWLMKPGETQEKVDLKGQTVDKDGNIWFANYQKHSVCMLPRSGFDSRGNPIYDWSQNKEIVPPDRTPYKFIPIIVRPCDDGSFFVLARSEIWKPPANNQVFGSTAIGRYSRDGRRLWMAHLPEAGIHPACSVFVALAVSKDGNAAFAGGAEGHIFHFNGDGLLIGKFTPGDSMLRCSGWLDFQGCVSAMRDPRDQIIDVFAEDSLFSRIAWYRVDDRNVQVLKGAVERK